MGGMASPSVSCVISSPHEAKALAETTPEITWHDRIVVDREDHRAALGCRRLLRKGDSGHQRQP
jgi:hypothetical protein